MTREAITVGFASRRRNATSRRCASSPGGGRGRRHRRAPIRPGTTVIIPIHHIHHDARWWPDPEAFDPTRFLGDATKDRPRSAYLPFGGGRRICIGQSFALMEMVLMAAIMSQQFTFDLQPDHPVELEATLTLRHKHGVQVIGRKRGNR